MSIETGELLDLPTTADAAAEQSPARWVDYYELTKPRMNFLVVLTTMVGFYMASQSPLDWRLCVLTLIGTALTAASASVFNQLIERNLDARMPRTRNRPLPAGRLTPREALAWGVALGICGVIVLVEGVNLLTASLGTFTLLSYIFVYTPLKRVTTLNTVIGAIPGAIPPMMGFTAVQNTVSTEAMALFAILFFWQMPHFLAIAVLYRRDYALAGFRMLPVIDADLFATGRQMVLYAVALVPVSLMPTFAGVAGYGYCAVALMLSLAFLSYAVSCAASRERLDARKLFFASIIYLPVLLGVMMLDRM